MHVNNCVTIEGGIITTFDSLRSVCEHYGVNKTMSAIRVAKALDRKNIILITSSFLRDEINIYDNSGYILATMQTKLQGFEKFKITI